MTSLSLPVFSSHKAAQQIRCLLLSTKGVSFPFTAGQFIKLTIPNVNDPRGDSRFFSITSAPSEQEYLMVATTISESPFKQAFAALRTGDTVLVSGPYGKFVLTNEEDRIHVFISGGVGITPFHSILKDALDRKLPHHIILFYSNHTPADIVFKDDLEKFAKENPNLTIVHTITQPEDNNEAMKQFNNRVYWETGRIDEAIIRKYVNDLSNAIFYICGPPSMVEALTAVVKGMGISEENIKLERFTGYT